MASGKLSVFDLHCDTLDKFYDHQAALLSAQDSRGGADPRNQISWPSGYPQQISTDIRLREPVDFNWCQCFAIFFPERIKHPEAWQYYLDCKRLFDISIIGDNSRCQQVFSAADINAAFATGRAAAILTLEGGTFLQDSLEPIGYIARQGVRMFGLTWNNQNAIAGGTNSQAGFSSFGRQVVASLEEQGVIIDASHLSDTSFRDLLALSTRPFVASHSNSRSICNHPRNLTDGQFRAIVERQGLVGLNFCNYFLTAEPRTPTPSDVLRHIDHWLGLGGEHVIALGSDYDGADIPPWLTRNDKLAVLHGYVQQAFGELIATNLFSANAERFYGENL